MDEKYQIKGFTVNEITQALAKASPLQVSKVMIDMELYDQKDSLAVLSNIYQDFESKDSVIDELVTPIGLSILDGIISHKNLKLNRTGLTASRVWSEIKDFSYSTYDINAQSLSNKQQLEAMRAPREYNKDVRKTMTKREHLEENKDQHFGDNKQAYSSIEVNPDGSKVTVYRKQNTAKAKGQKWKASDTDHIVPVKQINDKYAKNSFISDSDIQAITDGEHNFIEISNSLNRAKGAKNFSDMLDQKRELKNSINAGIKLSAEEEKQFKKLSKHTDKTLEEGVKKQKNAEQRIHRKAQEKALDNLKNDKTGVAKKAGGQASEQSAYQAIGHTIIMFIKPLFYELNDAIKFGFSEGVGKSSTIEGIKFRFSRLMVYVKKEILPTLGQAVKDFCSNFFKVIIEGVLNLVTGLFKSVMKIISEGFSAFVGAVKILNKTEDEMSSAEKADAILKLFASTVVTFVIFYFEATILQALPDNFVKDIALAMLSGVASTIVVYLLDKADLFSAKEEKRSRRVNEVFDYRIKQIKENTDAFEEASIKKLAEDKLQFRSISEQMQNAIHGKRNVNQSVYDLANFLKIDLEVKNTNQFLQLLTKNKELVV
ncbi:hypothetical protein [Psychromonas sp. L1A2]|uniref:hypothetical protein n=1 Tax=Psychromonas sp. L1A2 TaxID=2686356 RepID=UPI00135C65F4|nr:hypothetical protein [Psychromonas sp. L1A2]